MTNKKRASLNITKEVKEKLDEVKHPGQSYDGLIQELVKHWEMRQETKKVVKYHRGQASVPGGQSEIDRLA